MVSDEVSRFGRYDVRLMYVGSFRAPPLHGINELVLSAFHAMELVKT